MEIKARGGKVIAIVSKGDKEIKKIVNESAEFAKASPEPELDELYTDIYA